MSDAQPSGTVTLVFTDVEGSTRLLEELGTDAYRGALAEHRRVVREAFDAHEGYEVDYEGDAFFYAFAAAEAAVSAVSEAMVGLAEGPIRIRVGIHSGEPALDPPKYVGMDVHRAARIMSAALEPSENLFELHLPANEGARWAGQVRVRDRLERGKRAIAELVDRNRFLDVLQAVLAEVDQLERPRLQQRNRRG